MSHALVEGGIADVKRDEARRRQPESLYDLKTNSTFSTHTARRAEHKPEYTKSVIATKDGARPYSNVGHVKEAIAGLCRLVKHRHRQGRATGSEAGDLFRVHLALEAHARTLDAGFVPEADRFAQRCLRLGQAERTVIRQEVADYPQLLDPRTVGELLGLTDAERDAVAFRRADAIDLTDADREAKRKAADAARKQKKREEDGATPRSRCRARKRKLHPSLSQATFYRRPEAGL